MISWTLELSQKNKEAWGASHTQVGEQFSIPGTQGASEKDKVGVSLCPRVETTEEF